MSRSQLLQWSLVALACAASGCSSVERMNPMTWMRGRGGLNKADERKLAGRNPFQRDAPGDAGDAGQRRKSRLDDETRRHIDEELADATPAERAQWEAGFESLDPPQIRQALALRRKQLESDRLQEEVPLVADRRPEAPYQGLGAAYPGRESPDQSTASRSADPAFGHSQSFGDVAGRPAGVANSQPRQRIELSLNDGVESIPASDAPQRSAVNPAGFHPPGGGAAPIAPSGPMSGGPMSGDAPRNDFPALPLPPAETHQPAVVLNTPVGLANPAGDPSLMQRPLEGGTSAAPGSSSPANAPWNDELRKLIAVAEEQAYAAQTAWEQADQLAAGSETEAAARQELIADRRQDYVEKQVHLRMLYLMSGQSARSMERIRGLESPDQEFWTQVMWSLGNYFDVEGFPNRADRAALTIAELRSAIQHLQESAKLEIRKADFCKKISSFGNYETFGSDRFRPGQPVMVYAEIENFASQSGSDGKFRTRLKSTIEIHKVTGTGSEVIDKIEFQPTTDLCNSHRRDYYHSYELAIPDKATSGAYSLVLMVEDETSRRVATYSRNFTVE